MRLTFLGHAAFALEGGGVRLLLDPHMPGAVGGRFQLPEIQGPFDAIAYTHPHQDHAGWTPAMGTTRLIDGPTTIGGIAVTARTVVHDHHGGMQQGLVSMLSYHVEGVRVVHCGDLNAWTDDDVAWLRGTDVLLVPCGGTYSLGGAQAAQLVTAVAPRVSVPMHAADPRVRLDLEPIAHFLTALGPPHRESAVLDTADAGWDRTPVLVLDPP